MHHHRVKGFVIGALLVTSAVMQAAPIPAGQLLQRRFMSIPVTGSGSVYNPRICGDEVVGSRIGSTVPAPCGIARFRPGSSTPDMVQAYTNDARMISVMGGGTNRTWVIAAGGNLNAFFSRMDYSTLSNRVFAADGAIRANTFAWVDEDTIIASSYESGLRNRLYLYDITADPFTVTPNTTWNENGYVVTPVTKRIRSVAKGDVYSGYAYFSDNEQTNPCTFFAVNLATGESSLLGSLAGLTDSYGIWAVKEAGGYLYLQTTADGIFVYSMVNATTLGSLVAHHTKAQITAATGKSDKSYGFDVADNGQRIILGIGTLGIAELVQGLPFTEDFESYADGTQVSSLWHRFWSASDTNVVVTAGVGVSDSKAAVLPENTALTNTLYPSMTLTKVWTDMYLKSVKIDVLPAVDTNASVMLCINEDGYMTVYDANTSAWVVCSNSLAGAAVTPLADEYARITLFKDYAAKTVALFLNDVLLREGLPMIASNAYYRGMAIQNSAGPSAYLDNVIISTNYPVALTGDSDGDGWADVREIDTWGSISAATNGVPKTWLATHGLTDPNGNADADGLSNAEEYLAGTSPTNDASIFQILSIEQNGIETVLTIMGNDSGAKAPYVIERTPSLDQAFGPFSTVPRAAAPANTVYTNIAEEVSAPAFYRVKAVP